MVAITVLGPTRVEGTDTLSPRDRVVLGVLVANRRLTVTPEQLAAALWGVEVPESWRKVVQTVVMRLRKILGAQAIETTSSGYMLAVAPGDVDAWRFADVIDHARELVALGELDRAVYAFDDALAQWRGDPFQDLERWPLAAAEVARLEELRRLAEEQRLEALVELGRGDEVIAASTALALAEPLRERRWELLALALYRTGRQAEALRALSRARLILRDELGVEPRAELVALEHAILDHDPALTRPDVRVRVASERCPYKGLESYTADDAEGFFGRDLDVAAARRRLAEAGALVVTGGSGSGKSSLVRAGLVPLLRAEGRAVVICVPGSEPDAAVAAALSSAPSDAVLVVDQAEELFTVCTAPEARSRFIATIAALGAGRCPIVMALRADHIESTAAHPELRQMVEHGVYLLGPMTEPQLREAIEGPARQAGLRLEPGLVDLLLRDVVDEAGALPLLSHALVETWTRREGRVLTVVGYTESGGVSGAVARTAERLYATLSPGQRATTKALLLRLVEVSDEGEPMGHRLPRVAIVEESQREAVDTLVRARLVTADRDSIVIAHEALARAWPRLRAWLDEDRDGMRIRQHLSGTAHEWDALGRDPTELYRGARLDGALDWARSNGGQLAPPEQDFLDASVAAEEESVRARRRVTRRLRLQVIGLTVLLVVALVAAGLAVAEQRIADDHAGRADTVARAAQTSRVATLARTLPAGHIDRALLLGLEARRLASSRETEGALETALARTPPGLERVFRLDSPTLYPGIAPDGRTLGVPHADGSVRLLSVPALEQVGELQGRDEAAAVARVSNDGSRVAVGGAGGSVHVWDVGSGRPAGTPLATGGDFAFGFADPTDPTRVFTVTAVGPNGSVVLWDVSAAEQPRRIEPPYRFEVQRGAVPVAAISSDGQLLAAGSSLRATVGTTAVFDVQSHALLHELNEPPGAFAPGTHTLTTAGAEQVTFWDAATGLPGGEPLTGFGRDATTEQVFSPDGARLAVLERNGGIRVFDLASREQVGSPLGLDPGDIPVGFLADGRLVTSGGTAIAIWRAGITAPPFAVELDAYPTLETIAGKFVPGSDDVITETWGEGSSFELLRWDASTGESQGPPVDGEARPFSSVSPDGRLLVAPARSGSGLGVWNLDTSERVAAFGDTGNLPLLASWSPAGDVVVTGAADEWSLVLWDLSDEREPVRLRELALAGSPPPAVSGFVVIPYWSDDGRMIAAVEQARDDRVVTVFDVASGRKLWESPPLGTVDQVAFSPDGRTLAVEHRGRVGTSEVTLWAIGDWDRSGSFVLPGTAGIGVEFIRGGDVLVTTSDVVGASGVRDAAASTSAQLWDAATLEPIGEPVRFGAPGSLYVNRDADGGRVLIGSGGGTAFVWDVDVSHWEQVACRIAGRNLTRTEFAQYLPGEPYHATCSQWPPGR